jgi:hypothetical protein
MAGRPVGISVRWVVSALLVGCISACAAPGAPASRPATTLAAGDRQIRELLRQKIQDDRNWDLRYNSVGSKPGQLVNYRLWFALYPIHYAQEKLISRGSAVVEPLLRIMADPKESRKTVLAAGDVLARFDDPRIFQAYLDAQAHERMDVYDLWNCLDVYLCDVPVRARDVVSWAGAESNKSYEQMRLEVLDRHLAPSARLLEPMSVDIPCIRWLNRLQDWDIDEWLAQKAPAALEFRNTQLRKGYDPLFLGCEVGPAHGKIEEALSAGLYPDPKDQAAFRQLQDATHLPGSPLYPPERHGWQDRLRTWYRSNRPFLVYDFSKHRFVVDKSRATSAPAIGETK